MDPLTMGLGSAFGTGVDVLGRGATDIFNLGMRGFGVGQATQHYGQINNETSNALHNWRNESQDVLRNRYQNTGNILGQGQGSQYWARPDVEQRTGQTLAGSQQAESNMAGYWDTIQQQTADETATFENQLRTNVGEAKARRQEALGYVDTKERETLGGIADDRAIQLKDESAATRATADQQLSDLEAAKAQGTMTEGQYQQMRSKILASTQKVFGDQAKSIGAAFTRMKTDTRARFAGLGVQARESENSMVQGSEADLSRGMAGAISERNSIRTQAANSRASWSQFNTNLGFNRDQLVTAASQFDQQNRDKWTNLALANEDQFAQDQQSANLTYLNAQNAYWAAVQGRDETAGNMIAGMMQLPRDTFTGLSDVFNNGFSTYLGAKQVQSQQQAASGSGSNWMGLGGAGAGAVAGGLLAAPTGGMSIGAGAALGAGLGGFAGSSFGGGRR